MFTAAHAALFEGSYSCSRHLVGSLVRPSDDVIVDIGADRRGRDSDRGGDKKPQCGEMNSTSGASYCCRCWELGSDLFLDVVS